MEGFAHCSGAPTRTLGAVDEEQLERDFARATAQLRSCWGIGGRYWEVVVGTGEYIQSLALGAAVNHTSWHLAREIEDRFRFLPHVIIAGLCAPASCDGELVRAAVFPVYLAAKLMIDMVPPPVAGMDFGIRELSDWSRLRMDFAVVGVNTCGTTSLRMNLMAHPDVLFSSAQEDNFFYGLEKVLPYKLDVDGINGLWAARPSRARGFSDSDLFHNPRVRVALSYIEALRVVAVVCDPVSRFEKLFWVVRGCKPAADCTESLRAAVQDPATRSQWSMGHYLHSLLHTFGPRFWLLHQEQLRADPQRSFDAMAAFLGLAPFPADTRHGRFNSAPGQRTGLCLNSTLVGVLKESLAYEYLALERLFEAAALPAPPELRLRRTRCDRPADLVGPPLAL